MLAPETLSVVSVGGAPRDFVGWQRALQRQLTKTPALYDAFTSAALTTAVWSVRDRADDLNLTAATKAGPHALRIRPVFGPAGDVHAVRLWLGPARTAISEPRPAVGAIWDLASQTIVVPSGITELTGIAPEEYTPRMSIAELFHRVSAFDRHGEVLDLLYDPRPGKKLQFEATVTDAAGRSGRWLITIRARDDNRARGAWLLIEDVTTGQLSTQGPALEWVGLREAHRRAGTHLAVVHLEHSAISHWLTDPAPWVRWDYLFHPGDVFHPRDQTRLRDLSDRVRAGYTAGATVRTLDYEGGYAPTSLLLYPYPGFSTQPFAIVQFVRAAEEFSVSEPIADPRDELDTGPPIGYDEQLRHRMTCRMRRSVLQ